ncbi:polysaccharide pyruvyl transferase family protein [Mycolicibacterium sp. 050158]|uniref:polysaccharide pyruvyl transferase family protein n=1 Tax=Mycolicibacterium sp. 050158 TaxID=3090602 RepID=UPI00299EED44|nr:polysaccharide pyruvyl transferase family protein [Mycolicibacterium sp. 050158]MDX1888204.1 polysaccharide pyruvyl transferase family protein [Mycolicibacterium sp. 050158]
MRAAIFGTFDIGNFGDLMFPIIAAHGLSENGVDDVTKYSYQRKTSSSWFYDVEPIQDFPVHLEAEGVDLVLIGGGHLVHFNRAMAHGYGPSDPRIPHPLGFWWVPAIAARFGGIPAALNAVSVDDSIPRWAGPLMEAFLDALGYVAVRDNQSRKRLQQFANQRVELNVVPDTVHGIPDLVQRGVFSDRFWKLSNEIGLGRDYIIVQPSMGLRRFKDPIGSLVQDAIRQGFDVLELPIFHENVDVAGYLRTSGSIKSIAEWPDPLLLAELIANSQSVIGISLHLSIVASAYGIPVHRPRYSPTSKFVALDGLPNLVWLDDADKLKWIDSSNVDLSEVNDRRLRITEHWSRIGELARETGSPPCVRGWNQILQTPAAFRGASGTRDKLETIHEEGSRRMHLVAHAVRSRMLRSR